MSAMPRKRKQNQSIGIRRDGPALFGFGNRALMLGRGGIFCSSVELGGRLKRAGQSAKRHGWIH